MVSLGNLVSKYFAQLHEIYPDKLKLDHLLKTRSREDISNLVIADLGGMGICVLDGDQPLSCLCPSHWPLEIIWNASVDIENWQESGLPPVIKKNAVSEAEVVKRILQVYDEKPGTIEVVERGYIQK